ncbi:type VII secretion target [Rhodococcus sp. CSLK01-03]|uniref:Type VII secretion target n=1 Tax=Rhodococcus indonesiensis TaxID=3055869 RepID=A0ABT7RLU4_9NOCA|nr:type VII secretion target [Rhodococcus indonesiensis]MDM7488616.1 type VII secretion target [Rhodococcus indonesiensis]
MDAGAGNHDVVRARPETIAAFGRTAAAMAERLHEAAAEVHAVDPAPLAPAFGPVGTAFLAAFTATHRAHRTELTRLGGTFAAMGAVAGATAAAYERAVTTQSALLEAAGAPR